MCDATFTFGQRGSHFFQCPSRREVTRLPPKLTTLLSSPQLQKVHHVALGFQDSFLLTWRDTTGADRINSTGLPEELLRFLHAQGQSTRNIPSIRCVLGPYNASFFAHDSSAYLWMSIPDGLLTALQSRIKNGAWVDKPRIVALGADDDFVLITEKNSVIWDLGNYTPASDMLELARKQANGISDFRNIVLHPYRYGCFVTQSVQGALVHHNLPPHQVAGIASMVASVLRDSERKPVLAGSERKSDVQRRQSAAPPLQERARVKREWSGEGSTRQFTATAQSKGLKLSLSLSIGGLARMLG